MIWADNMTGHPRMGLIVPKFRATAVARNRLRRRLREIWRREILPQQPALDLIIRRLLGAVRSVFGLIAATMTAGATMIALTSHGGVTALVVGGLFQPR